MSKAKKIIVKDFFRPSSEIINRYQGIQSANIGDTLDRDAALPSNIRSINNRPVIGPAFTVDLVDGDNLMVYISLDLLKEGDVLVINARNFSERAILGEIIVKCAMKKKISGIVLNGAIRDYDILSKIDLPIFATSVSPNGPYKNGPGKINTPISLGNNVINPGDLIVGDLDGIIVVPQDDMEEVLEQVEAIHKKEVKLLQKIEETGCLDIQWAYDMARNNEYAIIDYKKY